MACMTPIVYIHSPIRQLLLLLLKKQLQGACSRTP